MQKTLSTFVKKLPKTRWTNFAPLWYLTTLRVATLGRDEGLRFISVGILMYGEPM